MDNKGTKVGNFLDNNWFGIITMIGVAFICAAATLNSYVSPMGYIIIGMLWFMFMLTQESLNETEKGTTDI